MTKEELEQAKILQKKIKELENFLWYARKVWTGKLVKQTQRYIIKSNPYGMYDEESYHLTTRMRDKMLFVLEEELEAMKKELSEL